MIKDTAPPPPAPTPQQSDKQSAPQKSDGQSAQQETRPNSPSSSCLDADATGGGGFIEEAQDDPYNNFFQSSQQSLPLPSPGFHFPSLFLARRFFNVISRRRLPPDESVSQERTKRGFFRRRAHSNSSLELATITLNQPVLERKVRESEGKQCGNVDDRGSAQDSLSVTMDKGKQRDGPAVNAQSPQSFGRILPTHLDSKDSRGLWERLMQARGKNITFGFLHSSTGPANTPQPILPNLWHRNSRSSRRPVDVAACRLEDRYAITPESDAEAAAAMLHTNDDVGNGSTETVNLQWWHKFLKDSPSRYKPRHAGQKKSE
ncbi:hypothetical protein BDR07DRAFT_1485038 [Suillus spraguei]|nr:hypothetical protein BDR07DRAFT_1485038 [Suillus spraguei]